MNEKIDYTFSITNNFDYSVGEVNYNFGELGDRNIGELNTGRSYTQTMSIPEYADFSWVTRADNKWHTLKVPVRENIHQSIRDKILLVEIHGSTLSLYIDELVMDMVDRRKLIYSATAP